MVKSEGGRNVGDTASFAALSGGYPYAPVLIAGKAMVFAECSFARARLFW